MNTVPRHLTRGQLDDNATRIDWEIMRMLWICHFASPHQLTRLVLGTASHSNRVKMNAILLRLRASTKVWYEPKNLFRGSTDNKEHFNGMVSGGRFYGLTQAGKNLMSDIAPDFMPELLQSHCTVREFYFSMAGRNSMRHSGHYTEFCTRFITEMRHHPRTLGIFIDTECTRLGSHLRMDGLLRHRFLKNLQPNVPNTDVMPWYVPWLLGLRSPGDPNVIDRTYSIEIDENTEELEIIVRKAQNYKRTFLGGMDRPNVPRVAWDSILCPSGAQLPPEARQKYFPIPVFVVPGPQRLANVLAAWQMGWPNGPFLGTHWGLLNQAQSITNAPYLNINGQWINLIGNSHGYQGQLPTPARITLDPRGKHV